MHSFITTVLGTNNQNSADVLFNKKQSNKHCIVAINNTQALLYHLFIRIRFKCSFVYQSHYL